MKKPVKMQRVMGEYKRGKLRSGSKKGPEVTNRKQAIAISLSEQRKAERHKAKKIEKGYKMAKAHKAEAVNRMVRAFAPEKHKKMVSQQTKSSSRKK